MFSKGIVLGTSVLIIISLLLFFYSNRLMQDLYANTAGTLKEISEQSATIINNEVESEMRLLKEISDKVCPDGSEFDLEYAMAMLNKTIEGYDSKSMGIILKSGEVCNTDRSEMRLTEIRDQLVHVFKGETVVTDRLEEKINGEYVIMYATPIYAEDEEVAAILFATYTIADLQRLLAVDTFGGNGYTYIVQRNGDTIVNSMHRNSFGDFENILDVIISVDPSNQEVREQLRMDMLEGKQGVIQFTNQEDKYMHYTPLAVNDWYVLSAVPTRVVDERGNQIMARTLIVCVWAVIGVICAMMYFEYEKRKSKIAYDKLHDVDPVTGGVSYIKFLADARDYLEEQRPNTAFMVLELQNFDVLLERHGRQVVDKMIKFVYHEIGEASRSETVCARAFDSQFIILNRFYSKEDLVRRLNVFKDAISSPPKAVVSGTVLQCTVGIYVIEDFTMDIMRIHNLAHITKNQIGSRPGEFYAFYSDYHRDTLLQKEQLVDDMAIAFQKGEFYPYFQPKYDTATQSIIGAEALVRWQKADGRVVYPNEFIPLAEETGFILEIDKWMFRAVCRKQRELIDAGISPVPVSVNLSRKVLHYPAFIDEFLEAMDEYDIPRKLVELELTERTLFTDQGTFQTIVKKIHQNGFKILVDDFGIGYSSLTMLKSNEIAAIKLDKSFIDNYTDAKGSKIITGIINLIKNIGLPVTAEGVETEAQYEFLREMDCDSIQGYYFARPMPFENFRDCLEHNEAVQGKE